MTKVIAIFLVWIGIVLGITIPIINYQPTLQIGGSTSVEPLASLLLPKYNKHLKKKSAKLIYNAIGSAGGIKNTTSGAFGIGFASESLTKSQLGILKSEQIAWDAILIIYHLPNGESSSPLDFSEIKGNYNDNLLTRLYSQNINSNERINDWSQISPNLSGRITLFTRESGSGTNASFNKAINSPKGNVAKNVSLSNGEMISSIEATPGSIGFASYAYIKLIFSSSNKDVQVSRWTSEANDQFKCDSLSTCTVLNTNNIKLVGDLKRPFLLLYNPKSKSLNDVKNFILFLRQKFVQESYTQAGFIYVKPGIPS